MLKKSPLLPAETPATATGHGLDGKYLVNIDLSLGPLHNFLTDDLEKLCSCPETVN